MLSLGNEPKLKMRRSSEESNEFFETVAPLSHRESASVKKLKH
jgi:hypothetical protein